MSEELIIIYQLLIEQLDSFEQTFEEKGGIAELKDNYIELRIDGYLYELINYQNNMKLDILKSDKIHYEFYNSSIIHIFVNSL